MPWDKSLKVNKREEEEEGWKRKEEEREEFDRGKEKRYRGTQAFCKAAGRLKPAVQWGMEEGQDVLEQEAQGQMAKDQISRFRAHT